jgi:hypothetical protein
MITEYCMNVSVSDNNNNNNNNNKLELKKAGYDNTDIGYTEVCGEKETNFEQKKKKQGLKV